MLHIPAGRFTMGSPPDEPERHQDEGPQHQVELRDFFLSRIPITQAQWLVVAGWQPLSGEEPWLRELHPDPVSKLNDAERFLGHERPVVNVSWAEAMEFCRRLSLRTGKHYTLPSEAQWEYACRAGTTTPFHFGETISPELANFNGNYTYREGQKGVYREQTTNAGSFPANAWGLHDMHGNVWEWCADHWHGNYNKAPAGDRPWINKKAGDDSNRLLRGGSWDFGPGDCRSAYRLIIHPGYQLNDVGFRVCCLPQDLFLYT
jgi:formylglycine-generating enzyme required for sulfatase activity